MLLSLGAVLLLAQDAPASLAHKDEIATWASIMADVRTATEVCPGASMNEDRLTAAKDRLHIQDIDYFAFRVLARARADAIFARLDSPEDVRVYCSGTRGLYGPQGSAVADALRLR